jgi:SAM-dependent methyltransferase
MADFDPSAYGSFIDDVWSYVPPDDAVRAIAQIADGGPVLEFGIGTGRLALPLAELGLEVLGLDGSAEMAALLRRKPGGADIPVVLGDFSVTEVPQATGRCAAVVLALNTIYALPSQDAQVACFANAARHLRPGGAFVLEAWVPDPGAFRAGRAVRPQAVLDGRVVLEVGELDPVGQFLRTNKVVADGRGVRVFPANHRYAWPAEMDLMARLAGMSLADRWGGGRRTPVTADRRDHVSVWRRPA